MTAADAARYLASYEAALDAIGAASAGPRHLRGPGAVGEAVGAASALLRAASAAGRWTSSTRA